MLGDRRFPLTVQVPNVQRQAEVRMANLRKKPLKARHRIDEHPRLWLERQANATRGRISTQLQAAFPQPRKESRLAGVVHGCSRPEAYDVGAKCLGDIHGPLQEVEAAL